MRASKRKLLSISALYRRLRKERKAVAALQGSLMLANQEIGRLLGVTATLERQKLDLGSARRTVESYYRARAIIAELLGGDNKGAISADLRQDILNALYYGLSRRPVRESVARGVYLEPETNELEVKGSEDIG